MSRGDVGSAAVSPRSGGLRDEAVTDAPDGCDLVAGVAQLLAQAADVVVHGAVEALEVAAPNPLDQELTIEGAPWVGDKQVQEIELLGGERELNPIEGRPMCSRLDSQPPVHDCFFVTGSAHAAFGLQL